MLKSVTCYECKGWLGCLTVSENQRWSITMVVLCGIEIFGMERAPGWLGVSELPGQKYPRSEEWLQCGLNWLQDDMEWWSPLIAWTRGFILWESIFDRYKLIQQVVKPRIRLRVYIPIQNLAFDPKSNWLIYCRAQRMKKYIHILSIRTLIQTHTF